MSITLRDIVARGTPLEWFESVAIVQELSAAVLKKAGDGAPRVPDLGDAIVGADGTVDVADAGPAEQSPVFRMAHVLNTLLAAGPPPPVQLRLVALTGLSPEPTHKSLLELSRALEFFERPDRRSVVRGVYARALRLPAVQASVPEVPAAPVSKSASQGPSPEPSKRRHRRALIAAISATAVLVLVAITWWLSRPAGARILNRTTQTMTRAVDSAVIAIRDKIAGPPTPAAVAETAPPPAQPPTRPAPTMRRLQRIRPVRSLAQGGLAPIVALAPSVADVSWTRPAEKYDETIYLNVVPPSESSDAVVYSASDPDVRPPAVLRPRQPIDPPTGVAREALTRLEVLVSPTGEVESVKMIAGPREYVDGMMLSAVKAWRYTPATRNGTPVPYREIVSLTTR